MMHMTFYWGKEVTLLFDLWKTESWTSYSLSLLACLVVAALYQYLENRRVRLRLFATAPSQAEVPAIQAPLLEWKISGEKAKLGVRFVGSFLFGVNSGIGYFLMLAIMSFNCGVFVAIVLGLMVGYFLFKSEVEDDNADNDDDVDESSCACA